MMWLMNERITVSLQLVEEGRVKTASLETQLTADFEDQREPPVTNRFHGSIAGPGDG